MAGRCQRRDGDRGALGWRSKARARRTMGGDVGGDEREGALEDGRLCRRGLKGLESVVVVVVVAVVVAN